MKVYLEFRNRSSHKFWQVEVDGKNKTVTSGKVGAKKAPQPKTKTFKSGEAAAKSADKDIAKKLAAEFFDPSSIEGVLAAHLGQLDIPSEDDVATQRSVLPHATNDYLAVYRTGALSVGYLSDFGEAEEKLDGEFSEMFLLAPACSAKAHIDDAGLVLDPYFYIVGELLDGSPVVQYNQGKFAERLGVIENGPTEDMVGLIVEGDPDATVEAWVDSNHVEPVSDQTFSAWILELLLHHKGAAVEDLQARRQALAAVQEAISGDPLEVQELDLSEKSLRMLPDFVGECVNLEVLKLRKNNLSTVPEPIRKMQKLKVLDLYYNSVDMSALPSWLPELPLRELNLALNGGGPLSPVIPRLTQLEVLELSDVHGLPASIGELSELRSLNIGGAVGGPLEEGGLGRLEALQSLNLGRLSASLPEDIGNLKALEVLKFEAVERETFRFPASIAGLSSLRVLHTGPATLTPAVCQLSSLEELFVHGGNDSGLPENLGSLSSLRVLNLHYLKSKALPESIGKLRNLEQLNLEAAVNLERLPDSFEQLTSLRHLKLPHSVDIGDRLCGLENLEFLALFWQTLQTPKGSLDGRRLKTLKVYSRTGDDLGELEEVLAFVHELPVLETLGVPYKLKDHFREKLPHVVIV